MNISSRAFDILHQVAPRAIVGAAMQVVGGSGAGTGVLSADDIRDLLAD